MSILYADDDRDDRDIFAEVLSDLAPGLKLITVPDGADVIGVLEQQLDLPMLVILDMNMPRMTGLDCLIEMRKWPRYANLPVVIFSTTGQPESVGAALENGADEYFLKANSYATLKTFIENIIVRYRLIV